jgi:hypothetical protein
MEAERILAYGGDLMELFFVAFGRNLPTYQNIALLHVSVYIHARPILVHNRSESPLPVSAYVTFPRVSDSFQIV